MAYAFGTGLLALVPSGSNPTPVQVAVLKDVSVDVSTTTKELRGQYQMPLDVARAEMKVSVKAKSGTINGALINNLLAGSTIATGSYIGVQGESGTVPATSTYTITVAHSADFGTDFGVYDSTAGEWLSRGAAAAAGVYAVSSGTYTFNSSAASHSVKIYYSYASVSVGKTITYTNQLMGSGTVFKLYLFNSFRGKEQGLELFSVVSGKLSFGFKNSDYMESDIDFEAFADDSGNVLKFYTA